MDEWLLQRLACPRHKGPLRTTGSGRLACDEGCSFPVVEGVPVLLLSQVEQTLWVAEASLRMAESPSPDDPLFVGTLGISDEDREGLKAIVASGTGGEIDPVVSSLVLATCGNAYRHLKGAVREYPIPDIRLPPSRGDVFLDLGCNWGRWCIAAARKGYRTIGLDPSLGAVLAAKRLARTLGVEAAFVVGDARHLPFASGSIDTVFSYSVLQHMSEESVEEVLHETGRALRAGGQSLVQMPSRVGVRCLYQQARRGFRKARGFEVRYWSSARLRRVFEHHIGPSSLSVDCYFGIGLQYSDLKYMPSHLKAIVRASEMLRRWSERFAPLRFVADSWYVRSMRR
jgi:ubiquinone/menaquinone biosynthesis C-methylase UbiE/uncharacterized protein YbaR (Trm112 family)